MAVWFSGSMLVSIVLVQPSYSAFGLVSTGMGDHARGSTSSNGNLSRYITSHPGQLSLAIPPWIGLMSTSQRAVMLCGWSKGRYGSCVDDR